MQSQQLTTRAKTEFHAGKMSDALIAQLDSLGIHLSRSFVDGLAAATPAAVIAALLTTDLHSPNVLDASKVPHIDGGDEMDVVDGPLFAQLDIIRDLR